METVHSFGTLVVGADSSRLFYHGPQLFRILQHGAGTEHIFMKGLSVVVGHKERAFERVQKRGLVDVAVGILF